MVTVAAPSGDGRHPARVRIGAGTTIALLLTAVYALLALSSGLDRIAAASDHVAGLSLPPFVAGHERSLAARRLLAGQPGDALAPARDAAARDPIDAQALGLLGAAAFAAGDDAYAQRSFTVAARLGWREPLTQTFWLGRTLVRGDYRAAGDHLDAILRQSPDLANRNELLGPFDSAPEGRRVLARLLLARPAWAPYYFMDTAAPTSGAPLARSEVAGLLAGLGQHDCALIAPLIDGLLRHGLYDRAAAARAMHCEPQHGGPRDTLAVDGRLRAADVAHPPTALDWRFSDDGAIDAALGRNARIPGRAVTVDNSGSVTLPFMEQPLMLPAGSYMIAWRARDAADAPSPAIEAALTCGAQDAPWLAKTAVAPQGAIYGADVVVPADCPRQRLVFGIAGGAREVAIGDIALRRR